MDEISDMAGWLRASAIFLTYNQELFVEDAITSVLQQKCEPVEIVISDDCSTDGTWNIICRITSQYAGPHKVVLNRNETNIGINAHINQCVGRTHGCVIIAAAGDDISEPGRFDLIIKAFEKTSPLLVHSLVKTLPDTPDGVRFPFQKASFLHSSDVNRAAASFALYIGATAAWSREIFTKYGPLPENGCYEDLILGFRAALEDRVTFIEQPLVRYRVNVGVSAHTKDFLSTEEWLDFRRASLERNLAVLQERLKDARTFGLAADSRVVGLLRHCEFRTVLRLDVGRLDTAGYWGKYWRHPFAAASALVSERTRQRAAERQISHRINDDGVA
jgi:glycosyltransferase involved in cell wall biosynthesis